MNSKKAPQQQTLPRLRCVICGDAIKDEYGHDARPVAAGQCCDACNYAVVVPARIAASGKRRN